MIKTYITGQLSDSLTEETTVRFGKAEDYLQSIGRFPVNPLKINSHSLISWSLRMELLSGCNAIYLLSDWQQDPKAITERFYSELTGKEILYQDTIEKSDLKILMLTEAIREVSGWIPSDYRIIEKGTVGRSKHKGYLGRLLFTHYALQLGMSLEEICKYFDRDRTTLMWYPAKFERECKYNCKFRSMAEGVSQKLLTETIKQNGQAH